VVTIGVLRAGTKENVIPDDAVIKLNVRTFDEGVRKHILAAIERIVNAEAAAAGAPKPPEITPLDRYSSVTNDIDATEKVVDAFRQNFPDGSVEQTKPTMASEDFGCFGAEWHAPAVYWFFGGDDPEAYAKASREGTISSLPTNHNPRFAPVIHPTLKTGVKALVVAAHAWLAS
jgi:hippurate hydrolase